uniref:Secreted protein n=1 Tax=Romanomermis culicivorax TaxID=13658 RepID=A0A915IMK6_ROMCU
MKMKLFAMVSTVVARIILIIVAVALRLMMSATISICVSSMAGRGVHTARHQQQRVCSGPWNQLRNQHWAI